MKTVLHIFLIICIMAFLSCSEDTPVSNTVVPPQKKISTRGYGSVIDSTYFKVWSDSSWEEFSGLVTFDTVTYATIRDNDFTVYYYNEFGFAGFQFSGLPVIWFDSIPPPLPETLVCGQTYTRSTSYGFQGQKYYSKTEQVLEDTTTVAVSFGTFSPCLWFKAKGTVTVQGQSQQSNSQLWVAKGPSSIKYYSNSGKTTTMVRGRVNFQGWGMPYPKRLPNSLNIISAKLAEILPRLLRSGKVLDEKIVQQIISMKK